MSTHTKLRPRQPRPVLPIESSSHRPRSSIEHYSFEQDKFIEETTRLLKKRVDGKVVATWQDIADLFSRKFDCHSTVSCIRNRWARMNQTKKGVNICTKCGKLKRGHTCRGRRNDGESEDESIFPSSTIEEFQLMRDAYDARKSIVLDDEVVFSSF